MAFCCCLSSQFIGLCSRWACRMGCSTDSTGGHPLLQKLSFLFVSFNWLLIQAGIFSSLLRTFFEVNWKFGCNLRTECKPLGSLYETFIKQEESGLCLCFLLQERSCVWGRAFKSHEGTRRYPVQAEKHTSFRWLSLCCGVSEIAWVFLLSSLHH